MKIPRKLKCHFLKIIGLIATYYEIMHRLEAVDLLMSVVTPTEPFKPIKYIITGIFLMIMALLCWRLYTGVYRDEDFWIE